MRFYPLKDEVLTHLKKRTFRYAIFILILSSILVLRLIYLQIISFEYYKSRADSVRLRIVETVGDRGFILDRNGKIIVKNTPSFELVIVRENVKDLDKLLLDINNVLPIDIKKVKKRMRSSHFHEYIVVARGLSFEQMSYFSENSEDYVGMEIRYESVRTYVENRAMSNILGYVREIADEELRSGQFEEYNSGDMVGKKGVERQYEHVLRGKKGAKRVEVDSAGRILGILYEEEARQGNSIILTVDSDLQTHAHELMEGKKGAVIVMDIDSNSLLTSYSAPTYDLNMFTPFIREKDWRVLRRDANKPLLDRTIEEIYPPGSVFKPLMALGGLEEKVINESTTYLCNGMLKLNRFEYRCWNRRGHGNIAVVDAIAESCDVFFYNLGLALGIDKIGSYARLYGLGEATGVDLPGEKDGIFPGVDWKRKIYGHEWYPGETVIVSIGQGYVSITPLQLAVSIAGIFNGGYIYEPRVVHSISYADNGTVEVLPTVLKRTIEADEANIEIVKQGISRAVYGKKGTARVLGRMVDGVVVGGKTGTAQVVSLKVTEGMEDDEIPEKYRDHAWFAAILPLDEPKYVVLVIVEHGGSGSATAAPIAGHMINKMIEMGHVEKD